MPESPASTATVDIARLVKTHQAGVWRYLRAIGCESALAEDLTQDTFVAVFERPFEERSDVSTAAYLKRTAFNLYISHCRRSSRVELVDDVHRMEVLQQLSERWMKLTNDDGEDALRALKKCMEELTQRARLALEMRFRDNASREQIAVAVGIGEHGAKNLMQRAKDQLRKCVERIQATSDASAKQNKI